MQRNAMSIMEAGGQRPLLPVNSINTYAANSNKLCS